MHREARNLVDSSDMRFDTFPPSPVVPLHPAIRAMLDAEIPGLPFDRMTVQELRQRREALMLSRPMRNESVERVENRMIDTAGATIPLRIYRPTGGNERLPILVFFHGGGWVMGTLDTHDDVCRTLASRSGVLVVAVDYRRAPEYRFPAPLQDCCAAVRWCADHGAEIGGDGGKLAVAGDSAGGNLAAAVALRFRDDGRPDVRLQALIYPVANCGFDTASYHRYAQGFGLTRDMMRYFWTSYLAKPTDGHDAFASPLQADDLSRLPPALVLTAQYDVLRDEGEAYAARLAQAGVPVRCTRYLEMNHGFIGLAALCDPALHALVEMADFLRAGFSR
jgi:acetyl esterase